MSNKRKIIIALAIVLSITTLCGIGYAGGKYMEKQELAMNLYSESVGDSETIDTEEGESTVLDIGAEELTETEEVTTEDLTDETSEETEAETEEEEEEETTTSSSYKYYIKVNYTAQVVTVYSADSEGNYTVPVKAFICSTGSATPTSGVYNSTTKYRWHTLNGGVYGQYCTRITGSILFHSVPYSVYGDAGSLKTSYYDKLGTYASSGCVRLTVEGAKWIYDNCAYGTPVEFYSSSDPGPLGKPSAMKISDAEGDLKNWDPTDPASDNPWIEYFANLSEDTTTEDTTTEDTTTEDTTTEDTTTEDTGSTDTGDSGSTDTGSSGGTGSGTTTEPETTEPETTEPETTEPETTEPETTEPETTEPEETTDATTEGTTATE